MAVTKFHPVIKKARINVVGYPPAVMLGFAQFVTNDIRDRMLKAQDIYDQPAPALSERYADHKVKGKYHGDPVRNLKYSGQMQRSMVPLEAGTNYAVIGFNNGLADLKARVNNNRSRMFGLSPLNFKHWAEEITRSGYSPILVTQVVGAAEVTSRLQIRVS